MVGNPATHEVADIRTSASCVEARGCPPSAARSELDYSISFSLLTSSNVVWISASSLHSGNLYAVPCVVDQLEQRTVALGTTRQISWWLEMLLRQFHFLWTLTTSVAIQYYGFQDASFQDGVSAKSISNQPALEFQAQKAFRFQERLRDTPRLLSSLLA